MNSPRGGAMRLVLVGVALVAAAFAATVAVRRHQRRAAIERALGRDLQPGMTLAEVTAHLRRVGVEFTVDTADGATIVHVGRESSRDRRVTSVTEEQIVFDARGRLRAMRSVDQLQGR